MIVGLTGGIGSGKSTVASLLRSEGIIVVDADQVARDVVSPGTEGLTAIAKHFGEKVVVQGQLDRSALRARIFRNTEDKKWLEDLLHPMIREQMLARLNTATSPYKVLEAPLLFENQLEKLCSKSILVDLPEDLQLERASKRDNSDANQIQTIIQSQMDRQSKLERADYVLDNSGDLDALKLQTLRLHNILLLLAQNPEFS